MIEESTGNKNSGRVRIGARVSYEQRQFFEHAAAIAGRSLSEFLIDSMQQAAGRIIEDQALIRLSRDEQIAFVTLLLDPLEPGGKLRQAAAEYRQKTGR